MATFGALAIHLLALGANVSEPAPANELGARGLTVMGRRDSELVFLLGATYQRRLTDHVALGGFVEMSIASIGREYDRNQSLHRTGATARASGEPFSWLRGWAAVSFGGALHVSSAHDKEVEPLGEASAGIDLLASVVAFGPFVHAGTGGANKSYVGYGLQVLARF